MNSIGLFSLCILCCLTNGQILTISTDNVTVSYRTTAYLECSVFVNTTTLDTNDQVNLTTIEIQRSPPLDRATLNYSLIEDDDTKVLTLTLDNVLLSDEGLYMCSATVKAGTYTEMGTSFFELAIDNYYDLILSINAANVTVMHNSSAVLRCSVEVNETAISEMNSGVTTISIEKIGNTLPISDHTEEEDGIFTKTITITKVQTDDFSQYQCTVSIGEETSIITFWLDDMPASLSPSQVVTQTISLSVSPSPTDTSSDDPFNEQLLFIIVISAIIMVTVIIMFAIGCYFFAGNVDIFHNKDELRMNKMERKMNRNTSHEHSTSLHEQELGSYGYNNAYNVDLDEEEIEESIDDERQWEEQRRWEEQRQREEEQDTIIKKEETHNQNYSTVSLKVHYEQLGDTWRQKEVKIPDHDYSSTDEEEEYRQQQQQRQIGIRQHLPTASMQHGPPSTQTMDTELYDEDTTESESDETLSLYSDDVNVNTLPIPDIVLKQDKIGKIRKSSLRLSPPQKRPPMKKKVSMGSVEILDDEGEKVVSRRVEFNDGSREEDVKSAVEDINKKMDVHPSKKDKPKKMDDVMSYLDNVSKGQRKDSKDIEIQQQSQQPPPSTEKSKKLPRFPTPFPSKVEKNPFVFSTTDDVITSKPNPPRGRSKSLDVPKPTKPKKEGGFFGNWARSSSTSKKEESSKRPSKKSGVEKEESSQRPSKKLDNKPSTYSADVFY